MKVVAIVPMKLNNQRLPNKNIKPFTNGKPLCHYVLSTLTEIDLIDEIYVYCSSEEIKKFLPDGIIYLKRDESLDQNTTKINEILRCFVKQVPSDIYLLAHVTSPFTKKESIESGIEAVISGDYDSSFSAEKMQDFLWDDKGPINYKLDDIPRTQDLPTLYKETSGFYIFKREVVTKLNRRIGNNPKIIEVHGFESIDIDEKEDFDIADAIFNYKLKEF